MLLYIIEGIVKIKHNKKKNRIKCSTQIPSTR
jgi:hypothetical protein